MMDQYKAIRRRTADLDQAAFSDEVPRLLQRIYTSRGICWQSDLNLSLARLPLPESLKDIECAVDLLRRAIDENWKIIIIGDFDADGATSTAFSILALRAFGASQVEFLVPNRFEYGYGLTPEIVQLARQYSPDLLITVDNGISSVAGVEAAREAGIKVLLTDHHLPGEVLPRADAIVNPNQKECRFPGKNLAGVGVVFYLLSALRGHLRKLDWFQRKGLPEPNLAEWLDLVALGTVADVVPMDGINRILVHQGLQRIRSGRMRPGIRSLLSIAGRNYRRITAKDLGFSIGPRLNAAGRIDDMSIGIRCLLLEHEDQCWNLARKLDDLNRDRRLIEVGMQEEAIRILNGIQLDGANAGVEPALPWGLCLYDASWHQGVVGLLASRIVDRVHRPVIAFAPGMPGEIKGSARSIPGLHIRDVLDAVATRHPRLIYRFGGHAMAAGLALPEEGFSSFAKAFDSEVRLHLSEADLRPEIMTDGELADEDFSLATAELIRGAGPWGQSFPEPCFDGLFHVLDQRIVGERHLKLRVKPAVGERKSLDAICFNANLQLWPDATIEIVRMVFRMDINEYRKNANLQLLVEQIEPL